MQVQMIQGRMNDLIYRPPDTNMLNYFNERLSSVATVLGDAGRAFIDNTRNMFNKYNSEEAINANKALIYGLGLSGNEYQIYPCSRDNMGQANYIMRQYIMAQPEVNKLYRDQMCDGFNGTYFDREPGVYGKDRDDYRQVMTGVMQFETVKEEEQAYIEYHTYGDLESLDMFDKYSVLSTWDEVKSLLVNGIDPTSEEGEQL